MSSLAEVKPEGYWHQVDPESVPGNWGLWRDLVNRALDHGEGSFSERDILLGVLSGRLQLWSFGAHGAEPGAVCLIEIAEYPQQRKCLVRYVAGEGEAFYGGLDHLYRVARKHGCQRIEIYARKGWARKLPGWEIRHVVMSKEL